MELGRPFKHEVYLPVKHRVKPLKNMVWIVEWTLPQWTLKKIIGPTIQNRVDPFDKHRADSPVKHGVGPSAKYGMDPLLNLVLTLQSDTVLSGLGTLIKDSAVWGELSH